MKILKKIGICLTHQSAHLMEFTSNPLETKTIESTFTYDTKKDSLKKGEKLMHNKEQDGKMAFYKKLGIIIKNFDEVLLFGATKAKNELYNLLSTDSHFDKIEIDVSNSDKMTDKEQHSYVRRYFSQKLETPQY
jgi:hypothetical protein